MKTGIKVLAGAVALALSHGALAQTNANTSGTIWVDVEDLSSHASFFYDTGIAANSIPTSGYSFNLTTLAGYNTFISGIAQGDAVQYDVVGGYTPDFFNYTADVSSNFAPVTSGLQTAQAVSAIDTWLAALNNPSGGSTSILATASSIQKYSESGTEADVTGNLGLSNDGAPLGTSLHFYQIVTSDINDNFPGEGETTTELAGTWNLVNGVLSYNNPSSAVPLPAPVVLLVSGLGLMGVVARRRKAA